MKILYNADAGAGGGAAPDPWAGVADTHKPLIQAKGFKDVNSVFDAYSALERHMGVPADRLLKLPEKPEDEAGWNPIYNRLGRPEAPDKYAVPQKDAAGNDIPWKPEVLADVRGRFHKAGLTQKQVDAVLGVYLERTASEVAAEKAAQEKATADAQLAIKTEWGDKYDANMNLVKGAMRKFGGEDLEKALNESGLGNDVRLIKFFHGVGNALLEDSARGSGAGGFNAGDGAAAQQELSRLQLDADFQKTLNDPMHPGHDAAVKRRYELFQRANQKAA